MKKLTNEEQKEFDEIAKIIINNKEYQRRKEFKHHGEETVYDHCLKVAEIAYKMAKKRNLRIKETVIGALLHDFYYEPWQDNTEKKKFFKKHGFVHAAEALENSRKEFGDLINPLIGDIISKHMFPLNIKLPKYKETWVVTTADKIASLNVLKQPKKWYRFIGVRKMKFKGKKTYKSKNKNLENKYK